MLYFHIHLIHILRQLKKYLNAVICKNICQNYHKTEKINNLLDNKCFIQTSLYFPLLFLRGEHKINAPPGFEIGSTKHSGVLWRLAHLLYIASLASRRRGLPLT